MAFLKKYWKIILILIVVCAIVIGIGHFTGVSSKVFGMALDLLRADQSRVVETLEQQLAVTEKDLARVEEEKARLQKERTSLLQESRRNLVELERLRGERDALKEAFDRIVVPGDLDAIIADLKRLGISSIRRR